MEEMEEEIGEEGLGGDIWGDRGGNREDDKREKGVDRIGYRGGG